MLISDEGPQPAVCWGVRIRTSDPRLTAAPCCRCRCGCWTAPAVSRNEEPFSKSSQTWFQTEKNYRCWAEIEIPWIIFTRQFYCPSVFEKEVQSTFRRSWDWLLEKWILKVCFHLIYWHPLEILIELGRQCLLVLKSNERSIWSTGAPNFG